MTELYHGLIKVGDAFFKSIYFVYIRGVCGGEGRLWCDVQAKMQPLQQQFLNLTSLSQELIHG